MYRFLWGILFFLCAGLSSQAQLYFHNPSFEYPPDKSKFIDPLPDWSFCVGTPDGKPTAIYVFDTSESSKPYGVPSHLYFFISIHARTYFNDAGKITYPNAYRATMSSPITCGQLLKGHRYKIGIDAGLDINQAGYPYLEFFFGNSTCDTLNSIGGIFVQNTDWKRYSFLFIAEDSWKYFTLRCEDKYLDTNEKDLMIVSVKLDNLSPVVPDTAYNSAHFPIGVTCEGMGVYRLASPYTGQEQYWYRDTVLLGSGDMLRVSPHAPTTYTLVLGKDSCIPSVLQTRIVPDCGALLIDFPNAFSPNRDGHNDVFRVIPTANLWRLATYELSVYNRWGQRVFHSHDYTQGWDGKDAALGVYYWLCSYTLPDGTKGQRKGDLTLLP